MSVQLIGIFVYILLQVFISLYIYKKIATEEDYFLAGRSLGYGLAIFSIFATWFGAETCIGSSGAIFESGLSGGKADPFGYALCLLLMGMFFAKKLWGQNLTTLGDFFRKRFSRRVEFLAVMIMIPSSLMWAAAQIRAFGHIVSASSNLNLEYAILIAALCVIGYTMLGGLLADAVTDCLQSIVLIIGLIILFFTVLNANPHLFQTYEWMSFERLNPFIQRDGSWLSTIEGWMTPIIGSLIAQELISRIIAVKSPRIAQRSCYYACSIYLAIGLIPAFLGLVGPFIMTNIEDSETFLPLLAQKYLNPIFYFLFIGALVSAILSTVDSTLLAISSLISHNLILPFMKISSEKKKVFWARFFVFVGGLCAYFIAVHSRGVYELVESASAFGGSSIFIITVLGLYWKSGDEWSAMLALVVGVVSLVVSEKLLGSQFPFLISLMCASGVYVGVVLLQTIMQLVPQPSLKTKPIENYNRQANP